ncbi:hypothetical protein CWB99_06320 [Pseudoalteromonas rubra]|uniref:Uncharacterized protein n=1 Tax=Pseudoalteromonas rubra TaxID=43658 RepID=A0A5S3WQW4_9GAMM|nr:hypothetical protein [Pseudoalteromonas rubra]TMP30354.1 hypothetical protein CWB99_06320 [Pseudoalteromonas rubra]TMP35377.1 hypothetical protein CWC00_04380 [Pseudoalteromonas rubra]
MKATTKKNNHRLIVKAKKLKQLNGYGLSKKQLAKVFGGITSDGDQPRDCEQGTLSSQYC